MELCSKYGPDLDGFFRHSLLKHHSALSVPRLNPRVVSALLDIQARLHALIGEQCSEPHYRPAVWRPHCTIASSVLSKHRSAAKAFADEPIESFVMTFDVADALRWPPVTQIGSQRLSQQNR
jgi:hypothetical protein